ncbi:SCO2521 family protein [Cryptosporangium phraense]|uniref:Uncharacterized protein n=1 Tax=Cryptosporangium phraense TaxID=2593070 RepID=A0A545AW25_9ACTN|nr:SCO2521 family protein [Cryptosporangium phraense]TQS45538.1 hypothetical protein FL583_07310 [Cryptosporangium phraense]
MLVLSEVRTGLLRNSQPLTDDDARRVLALTLGVPVRTRERPIAYAEYSGRLTGVDCTLEVSTGKRPRLVGVVSEKAFLTGGRILQASATVQVEPASSSGRRPWSYYIARPGIAETIGSFKIDAIQTGFLRADEGAGLDLGSIAARVLDDVQHSNRLDGRQPFRSNRTNLRWILEDPADGVDRIEFNVEKDELRTLRISSSSVTPQNAAILATDVARHDWLLTSLLDLLRRSGLDDGMSPRVVNDLQPVVDHLLHLWMPAARADDQLRGLWEQVDRASGFSRQWETQVARVRDQLQMYGIAMQRDSVAPRRSA